MVFDIKGQAWTLDYAISLVLFIASLIAAVSIIGPDLIKDEFSLVRNEAEIFSQQLMSTGSPEFWNPEDVIRPGLLTDNKLSPKKLSYFNDLPREKKYDYGIVLKELNGSIINVGDECVLGSNSVSENKNLVTQNKSGAYYYKGNNKLLSIANNLNLDVYTNFSSLIDNILRYDYILLEDAQLQSDPDDDLLEFEKAEALEEFVELGNDLFIFEDIGIDIFNLELTTNNTNASIVYEDDFVNLTNNTEIDYVGTGFAINNSGKRNYEAIANINNYQDMIAKFNYGDGFVYYFGTLSASIPDLSESLLEHLEQSINSTNSFEGAECNSYSLPSSENRAIVKRLAPYKGRIVEINVYMWEK